MPRFLLTACLALAAACSAGPSRATPATDVPVDTGRVAVEGGSLFYEVAGAGPPVVLLHAAFVDRRMWDPQFRTLARHHRVYRYDGRGYGRSSPATAPFSRAADLAAFLDGVGLERAVLVGCSLGGATALDFAVDHPRRVTRLVLVGSGMSGYAWPPNDTTQEGSRTARAALARGDTVSVARAWLLTKYLDVARGQPATRAKLDTLLVDNVGYWKGLIVDGDRELEPTSPALPRLETVTAPTLLIVGDRDEADILAIADTLARRLPRARRVVLPGAGHVPNLEFPERFTALVTEFLSGR